MYVKQLSLSNFQNIKEFDATFNGNIYLVTGENEIGKSTFLKAITILLTGNRDEVLSTGEKKGFAKAVVGDDKVNYDVELRFTEANPRGTLSIKQHGTSMVSDKVSAIQSILGYQEFDAEEFVRWSETAEGRRKQVEIVKSLMPNEATERLLAIDKEIASLEEKRLQDGRELKMYDGLVKGLQKDVSDEDIIKYAKPVVLQTLIDKKASIAEEKLKYTGVKERMEARKKEIEDMPAVLAKAVLLMDGILAECIEEERVLREEFEKKLKAIQDKKSESDNALKVLLDTQKETKATLETQIAKAETFLKANKEPNADEVQKEIDNAQTHNDKHKKVIEFAEQQKKYKEVFDKVEGHQTKIDTLKQEKETIIKSSKLPVEGLAFSEDGLALNGVPFVHGKVSTSQEMEVATKLIIAKNPTTKVFKVARGESLGQAKFNALVELAKREGFQGFIEEVKRGQNDFIVNEYTEE